MLFRSNNDNDNDNDNDNKSDNDNDNNVKKNYKRSAVMSVGFLTILHDTLHPLSVLRAQVAFYDKPSLDMLCNLS